MTRTAHRAIMLAPRHSMLLTAAIGIVLSGCATTTKPHNPLQVKVEQEGIVKCVTEVKDTAPISPPDTVPEYSGKNKSHRTKPNQAGKNANPPIAASAPQQTSCEISAAAKVEGAVIFANDKPILGEDQSSIFSVSAKAENGLWQLDKKPHYFYKDDNNLFKTGTKYEALTVIPNTKWVVATTAFDRCNQDTNKKKNFNAILAWQTDETASGYNPGSVIEVKLEGQTDGQGDCDLEFRNLFKSAFKGEYFKIEGLTAIPDKDNSNTSGSLLFGVRETGKVYTNPTYAIQILEAKYRISGERLIIESQKTPPIDYRDKLKIQDRDLGLSSLEYDQKNNRLLFLTSFENGDATQETDIGSYLWSVDADKWRTPGKLATLDMSLCLDPIKELANNAQADILCLGYFKNHKAEGLTVLDNTHVLVVFDDDKIPTKVKADDSAERARKPESESGYRILEIKETHDEKPRHWFW